MIIFYRHFERIYPTDNPGTEKLTTLQFSRTTGHLSHRLSSSPTDGPARPHNVRMIEIRGHILICPFAKGAMGFMIY